MLSVSYMRFEIQCTVSARQIAKLKSILSNEDLKEYTGDAFWDLISRVTSADPIAGIKSIEDVKNLMFHCPTIIF